MVFTAVLACPLWHPAHSYIAEDGSASGSWKSGDANGGWDKDSDINVLATAVEAPTVA